MVQLQRVRLLYVRDGRASIILRYRWKTKRIKRSRMIDTYYQRGFIIPIGPLPMAVVSRNSSMARMPASYEKHLFYPGNGKGRTKHVDPTTILTEAETHIGKRDATEDSHYQRQPVGTRGLTRTCGLAICGPEGIAGGCAGGC